LGILHAGGSPVFIDALLEDGVGVCDLGVDELKLGRLERWITVPALVEGVAGEGLEVMLVGGEAHGFEFAEGGDDLVAGVVEDPVPMVKRD
jgi:hypothetical protein